MRQISVITVCFLSIILTCQAFAEVSLAKLVEKIQPSVVTIITYDKEMKATGQGSGFFIDSIGHVITNYHVLIDAYAARIKTYDGRIYPIKSIAAKHENMDLIKVLVDIPVEPPGWLSVARVLPPIATRILVIGSPMGLEQTVSEGIVSSIREIPNIGTILQISAPISPGSSGGPVLDMKGQVVGIVTFYLIKGQNLNFAIPSRYLADLKPLKSRLFVNTEPEGARIRILNIKPVFYQGIELTPGKYHIEVTASDYETKKIWITVEPGEDKKLEIYLKKSSEEKKNSVDAWNKWQQARKKEYEDLQQIDKSRYLDPDEKADVWRRFLAVVKIDNPFSNEDDAMRIYAKSRLSHWQSITAVPPKPPTPDARASAAPGREEHYIKYASGVVWDTKTGLEWVAGPDKDTNWDEAKTWIDNLEIDGGGWRMPNIKELKSLYEYGRSDRNLTPLLRTTGWWVWSGETKDSSSAWGFYFVTGNADWYSRSGSSSRRAFAVRSRHSVEIQKSKEDISKYPSISPIDKEIARDGHFLAYASGVVCDIKTGLEWVAGPDEDTVWSDAEKWTENLKTAGGGWRMPTVKELETLYEKGRGTLNMTPLLKATDWWVWSGETKDSSSAWAFDFGDGGRIWGSQGYSRGLRVFAVRSRTKHSTSIASHPSYESQKPKEAPKYAAISPEVSKPTVIEQDGHYIKYSGGIVKDTKTGLEWITGPDRDLDWYEACNWVKNLNINGGAWRMPTIEELRTIFVRDTDRRNMTYLLKTTGWYVWAESWGPGCSLLGLIRRPSFWFRYGIAELGPGRHAEYRRAFAVRSRR